MRRFGGEVAVEFDYSGGPSVFYPGTTVTANLTFSAPDKSTCQTIETAWRQFFSKRGYTTVPPWLAYYDGKLDPQADKAIAAAQVYFSQAGRNRIYWDMRAAEARKDAKQLSELQRQFDEWYEQGRIKLTSVEFRWIHEILEKTTGIFYEKSYNIECSGLKCRIEGLRSFDYAESIAAVSAWLEDQGCTEIDFTFVQDPPLDNKGKP